MFSRLFKTCAFAAACSFALGFLGAFVWMMFGVAQVHRQHPGIGAVAGGISFSLLWGAIAALCAIFVVLLRFFWSRDRSPR